MPWISQGGGGGQWGGGGGQGPWGRGSGGQQPPNLEDLLRQGQDRFKSFMPGGFGGSRIFIWILLGIAAIWLASGIYRVEPSEQGIVLRFGEWVATTTSGLHYHMPWPIESVVTPEVTKVHAINVGFRTLADSGRTTKRDVPEESLMITGDENIIDIDLNVQWRINDAGKYLFNIRDPEATVKTVSESVIREIAGQTPIQAALTQDRGIIEDKTISLIQVILDEYEAGVLITDVNLQQVKPPEAVIDAFNDVQRALQDKERLQNEAEAYRNDIVPRAKGEAEKAKRGAEAYQQKVVNEAEGESKRFLAVYEEYRQAKEVTLRRLYLETMEGIFHGTNKYIIGGGRGSGTSVAPYLPLPLPLPQESPGRRQSGANGGSGG